jgi:hypothetical protein
MLVRDDGETWTVIGQPAHAWLAAQLARSWREPLDETLVLAVEQHDAVWSEWDARPSLHAGTGRAASFVEVPVDRRQGIWDQAVERLIALDPHAALLVSMHATNIHVRYGDPAARSPDYLARRADEQQRLLATLGQLAVTRESAEHDADLLTCLDAISLALCQGTANARATFAGSELVVATTAPGEATITPWPFARGPVHVQVAARTLHERFEDEASLHAALDATPWHRLEWRISEA